MFLDDVIIKQLKEVLGFLEELDEFKDYMTRDQKWYFKKISEISKKISEC